jgi:hypothetical protein
VVAFEPEPVYLAGSRRRCHFMRDDMTVAICIECGSKKHGAFSPCTACGARPLSEDDLVCSLALTDHYSSLEVLEEISASMLVGNPRPLLSPEQDEKFRGIIRAEGPKLMRALEKMNRKGARLAGS